MLTSDSARPVNFVSMAICITADEVCSVRPNEVFSQCQNPCPKTCANYFSPPRPCPLYCIAGCDCKYGYVRDENNICIKLEDCPG